MANETKYVLYANTDRLGMYDEFSDAQLAAIAQKYQHKTMRIQKVAGSNFATTVEHWCRDAWGNWVPG